MMEHAQALTGFAVAMSDHDFVRALAGVWLVWMFLTWIANGDD